MKKTLLFSIFAGLILASCSTPEDLASKVFLNEVPKDNFETMTLADFPSLSAGNARGVALADDATYVVADPFLLKYDLNGKIVSYANPKILPCGVEVARVGEKLFVACRQEGVYEIDLVKNEIAYHYTKAEGLEEYQNPIFAVQGKTLWIGTFDGIAKIDTDTRKVVFYNDELGFEGTHLSSNVYTRGDQVWATVSANAYNGGGAGYYNADDTWTFFGPKDFKKNDLGRVDFMHFIVSDEGVFATYQDGGPENTVLSKFDPVLQKWNQIYAAGWDDFNTNIDSKLPAPETYKSYQINFTYEDQEGRFQIYRNESWADAGTLRVYLALSPLVDDTYYLLGETGIDSFSKEDAFPKVINSEKFPGGTSKFFVSADSKYLVILSSNINDMGGDVRSYAVQVLKLDDSSYYSLKIEGDDVEQEDLFQVSDKIEMAQDGAKMYVVLTSGKKLTLDLEKKTFGVE